MYLENNTASELYTLDETSKNLAELPDTSALILFNTKPHKSPNIFSF